VLGTQAELLQHQRPAQQLLGRAVVAARFSLFSSVDEFANVVGSLHWLRRPL
jgi:hypothetical protein